MVFEKCKNIKGITYHEKNNITNIERLLNEINNKLNKLSEIEKNTSPAPKGVLYNVNTTIQVATKNKPENPDVIANASTSTPGYDRHRIHNVLGRNAKRITVINDGNDTLYVINTSKADNWSSEESVVYPGETRTFFDVYELRVRSPTAGLRYRVMENDYTGRIAAYIVDPDDVWGNQQKLGLAEQAVRLGSIDQFDKRGNVVFMDDFEDPCTMENGKYDYSVGGTGAWVARSNVTSLSGSYSVCLTTGNSEDDYARFWKRFAPPIYKRISSEIAFQYNRNLKNFKISIYIYDGTNYYLGQVQTVTSTSSLQVRKSDFTWETFASGMKVNLNDDISLFHHIKLVIDLANMKYVRCLLDDSEYDLSNYSLYTSTSSTRPRLSCAFEAVNGSGGGNQSMYIDNFIFKENEP